MENQNQTPHKRRVRYKGKYPKKFEEKYKELQPEKYKDTIEHVIQKGNTPAGMHISIMVKEILDFLNIQPGETGFDATLGYGGHTKAMLQCLNGKGHIYATDVDPEESAKTKKRLAEQGFGDDQRGQRHIADAQRHRQAQKDQRNHDQPPRHTDDEQPAIGARLAEVQRRSQREQRQRRGDGTQAAKRLFNESGDGNAEIPEQKSRQRESGACSLRE